MTVLTSRDGSYSALASAAVEDAYALHLLESLFIDGYDPDAMDLARSFLECKITLEELKTTIKEWDGDKTAEQKQKRKKGMKLRAIP